MATKAKKTTAKKAAKIPADRGKAPPGSAVMPEVLGGVVPYLVVDGATRASEFYERAFGAKEMFRHPPDDKGRTMHIHLHLNGGSLMLCDAYPD